MKTCFLILITISTFGGLSLGAAESKGSDQVVHRLYKDFPWGGKSIFSQDEKTLSLYFDEELVAAFVREQKCEKECDCICHLGFDPIYDLEDGKVGDLRIGQMDPKDKTVPVTFKNYGGDVLPDGSVHLVHVLSKGKRGWKIHDIKDSHGTSLLKIMS